MEFNKRSFSVLGFGLLLALGFSRCCPSSNFPQIVQDKMNFMTGLREREGKQAFTGRIDTALLCNGIFFRDFQEPVTGVADPVTAKINFLRSRLFYRFEKPNAMGIGRVFISNRFTNSDFQQYYEKGRGLDYDAMVRDQANTYLKLYEIDENDGLVTVYTDNLTSSFYCFKGEKCAHLSLNETVSKNYWLAEAMNYKMEIVTSSQDANASSGSHVVLRKVSGKYPKSTDIFTDKEMTLTRVVKGEVENIVLNELAQYETDPSYMTSENICPFRWEAIQGITRDSLVARKVIFEASINAFNPVVVAPIRENTGWIFGGSASKDHQAWINQRIPRSLNTLLKRQSRVRSSASSAVFLDSIEVDFPTFLRQFPPSFPNAPTKGKGTIVNILLPEDRLGIVDLFWASGLNKEREVLWLKVEKLKAIKSKPVRNR